MSTGESKAEQPKLPVDLNAARSLRDLRGAKIILLVSGGPDSKTVGEEAKAEGAIVSGAVYLRTGNPAEAEELEAAKRTAEELGVPLEIIDVSGVTMQPAPSAEDLAGGGGTPPPVKRYDYTAAHAGVKLPPFAIICFLSVLMSYAHEKGVDALLIGLHGDDAAANPQYRKEFLEQMNVLARAAGVPPVYAPYLSFSKPEVIARGGRLGVRYDSTWSCTKRSSTPRVHCGNCGACAARQDAFATAGVKDPAKYGKVPATTGYAELQAGAE